MEQQAFIEALVRNSFDKIGCWRLRSATIIVRMGSPKSLVTDVLAIGLLPCILTSETARENVMYK